MLLQNAQCSALNTKPVWMSPGLAGEPRFQQTKLLMGAMESTIIAALESVSAEEPTRLADASVESELLEKRTNGRQEWNLSKSASGTFEIVVNV